MTQPADSASSGVALTPPARHSGRGLERKPGGRIGCHDYRVREQRTLRRYADRRDGHDRRQWTRDLRRAHRQGQGRARTSWASAPRDTRASCRMPSRSGRAPPRSLVITTPPSSFAQSGVPFAQQPVVQLEDASRNLVAQCGVDGGGERSTRAAARSAARRRSRPTPRAPPGSRTCRSAGSAGIARADLHRRIAHHRRDLRHGDGERGRGGADREVRG